MEEKERNFGVVTKILFVMKYMYVCVCHEIHVCVCLS